MKWVADRTEHFLGDTQGRDNITTAKLALDDKGSFLALDVDIDRRHGRVSVGLRALHSLSSARHVARRLRYSGLLHPAARGLHQHRAGRCLSRRRAAGGVLCDRAAGRCRGARARRRAGRVAAQEFHQAEGDAVRRPRPARSTTPANSPATWRARRRSPNGTASRSARADATQAGQAARHRPCDLYRGLRQQRPGNRDGEAREGRQRHAADRLAIDRAGARHVLCADRRRSSRPAARTSSHGAGRHRPDRDRRRHRRIELDPVRRRVRLDGREQSSPRT